MSRLALKADYCLGLETSPTRCSMGRAGAGSAPPIDTSAKAYEYTVMKYLCIFTTLFMMKYISKISKAL